MSVFFVDRIWRFSIVFVKSFQRRKLFTIFYDFQQLKSFYQFDFISNNWIRHCYNHKSVNNHRFCHFRFHSNRTSIRSWSVEKHHWHRQFDNIYQFSIDSCIYVNRTWHQNNFFRRIWSIFDRVIFKFWFICHCRSKISRDY